MKNKTIMGIIFALVLIPTAIAGIKEEGYFESLAVTGDTYLAGQLRVDGNTHFYGDLYANDKKGFTGLCSGNSKQIYEDGLLVECIEPRQ
jgi:hypothetical protein